MLKVGLVVVMALSGVYTDGFRGHEWGTPESRVLKAEAKNLKKCAVSPIKQETEYIVCQGSLLGERVEVDFRMKNGKLLAGSYTFYLKTPRNNFQIGLPNRMAVALVTKYGKPIKWKSIEAAYTGTHMTWLQDGTMITLTLHDEKLLRAFYCGVACQEEMQRSQRRDLDKL